MSKRKNLDEEITVSIRDQTWLIRFVDRRQMPRNTWGDCDRVKRIIRVRRDLSPVNFLDTLVHEIRHAQHPIMFEAEEFIDSTSTELAQILLQTRRIFVNHGQRKGRKGT